MSKFFKATLVGFLFFLFYVLITKPISVLGAVGSSNSSSEVESISLFESRIEINQDTSLSITEKINYQTRQARHGIYRYIPFKYNKDGFREVLNIYDISVTDEEGNPIPFSRKKAGNFIYLKIGEADKTFVGNKTYIINYTVVRGINQFESYNELYWDITGEGWRIPVKESKATVVSKFAPIKQVACFSGKVGGNDRLCQSQFSENQATFIYSKVISYGKNMTVVVKFPKESGLVFPSKQKLLLLWLSHNWPLFLSGLPLLLLFIYWFKYGRDYQFVSDNVFDLDPNKPVKFVSWWRRARTPMVYEPLKDLTPSEASLVVNGFANFSMLVAAILELARKKYLKIELEKKKFLFITSKDYKLTRLKRTDESLNKAQAYLLDKLFATGDEVKLSDLKGKFYTEVDEFNNLVKQSLLEKNIYTSKPNSKRMKGFLLYFFSFVFAYIVNKSILADLGISWFMFFIILQLPLVLLIIYKLPQRTAVGTNLWLQARGLRASIKRGAWRERIKEKNLFIEKVLPFAVALGVVKQLSKEMRKLEIKPPDYLSGPELSSLAVADMVRDFSKEVTSSLLYNPSSSSYSGGSGFSGGSSGGGGGGGGGGSW